MNLKTTYNCLDINTNLIKCTVPQTRPHADDYTVSFTKIGNDTWKRKAFGRSTFTVL